MPRKTVVCPECGKPVPSGRLACPACGSLVAAVTGPTRRTRAARAANESSLSAGSGNGTLAAAADAAANGTPPLVGPDAPLAVVGTVATTRTAGQLLGASQPMQPSKQRSAALGSSIPSVLADWPPKPPRTLDDPTGREVEPVARSAPSATPAGPVFGAYVPPSTPGQASSAYLAPSNVFNAATPPAPSHVVATPAAAQSPAGPQPATGTQKPLKPGAVSLFADLPFDAPNTLIGWLVAFGCGAGVIGFLLPWSAVVIGSASSGGTFTETWGLASPTQVLVLLVAVAGFFLSVLPNRVPAWLRTSLLSLVLGGVLIGLAWPYVFAGGFGYKVGVIVELVGALVLIVAGVLSILPSRHDGEAHSV